MWGLLKTSESAVGFNKMVREVVGLSAGIAFRIVPVPLYVL